MNEIAPLKFGMGASPRRVEDDSLIRGQGRYATDVTPVEDRVLAFELPDDAQPPIEYQVAVVVASDDKGAARAFVERLRGAEGRRALEAAGFELP